MLLIPTLPNASPLAFPYTPVYPTLPLFDSSVSASNPSTSTTNSSFFSTRTPPFLQTPPRFKRLHRQLDCENGNNNSFNFWQYHRHHTNEYQNLGESSGGSGLLEDLLEEAQAMAGSSDGFGRQTCFSSQEEKQVLDGFSPWGDSSSDNVIPSPMQVHEWYTGDGREASNGQSFVVTDDNLGPDMHQLASLCPMDTTADHGRVPSWDNFPGIR
ncbi:hypothetical protein SLEP1_g47261 [Rubroshorea leprosula]|uniref:Uncharacterized protein n=1 Tax=Rubroshorea leprosula TaxID=152421 RepID=A0AAV5LPY0_9ROSI|nr:hypothetical protein SLEP1_g47261 [Rubroshorea leprosula]